MHPCVCSQVTAMGNANCTFVNDTGANVELKVYNYADRSRMIPRYTISVKPGQRVKCEAAAHGSGLILASVDPDGGDHHKECANGSTVKASQVLGGRSY